jgi:hypothetical protein
VEPQLEERLSTEIGFRLHECYKTHARVHFSNLVFTRTYKSESQIQGFECDNAESAAHVWLSIAILAYKMQILLARNKRVIATSLFWVPHVIATCMFLFWVLFLFLFLFRVPFRVLFRVLFMHVFFTLNSQIPAFTKFPLSSTSETWGLNLGERALVLNKMLYRGLNYKITTS